MSIVLDSSAVLALLWNENGADVVAANIIGSEMSAVNHAEVLTKLEDRQVGSAEARALLARLAISVVAFDERQAERVSGLRASTRAIGLSLGDRACIALAQIRKRPVLTADQAWAGLNSGVVVKLLR